MQYLINALLSSLIYQSYIFLQSILTSIVLKSNVTMLDIVSTRMLGQYGFLAKVHEATDMTHDSFVCFRYTFLLA